jgi:hypothetical protein
MGEETLSYQRVRRIRTARYQWIARILEWEGALIFYPGIGIVGLGLLFAAPYVIESAPRFLLAMTVLLAPCALGASLMAIGMALGDGETWAPAVAGILLGIMVLLLVLPIWLAVVQRPGLTTLLHPFILLTASLAALQSALLIGIVVEAIRPRPSP